MYENIHWIEKNTVSTSLEFVADSQIVAIVLTRKICHYCGQWGILEKNRLDSLQKLKNRFWFLLSVRNVYKSIISLKIYKE